MCDLAYTVVGEAVSGQGPQNRQLSEPVGVVRDHDSGFPPDKVRVVSENARTLKFEQFGFEDR